ncbi:MAG: CRISPR-associated endonuclease Cas1 [Phycisphaeraceae bacterium]
MSDSGNDSAQTTFDTSSGADLLPIRMLNEYAYCPRLFHLMHVEGRWADNVYTIEGRHVHRRVDKLDHVLPQAASSADADGEADDAQSTKPNPVGDEPPAIARSVPLGSDTLGLTAKLDLVSVDDSTSPPQAVPGETKRGRVPDNPERSWEPERVQLMAQGLLLREHGYHCDHGVLYFAGSRTRVDIPFTHELEARTLELLAEARRAATATTLPPPLDDSPKCNGCSLAGICLPDETLALQHAPADVDAPTCRRLYPARELATPLYVQEQGAYVGKRGASLIIRTSGEELATARLKDVSQLVLCGNVQVSTQTIHQLCEAAIPVVYLSTGHWFYGVTAGLGLKNAFDRAAQFQAAQCPASCLAFARQLVIDKAVNQRALLRRNGQPSHADLRDMTDLTQRAAEAPTIASLLGIEGSIARIYFQNFASLLKPRDLSTTWDFNGRNRRPPRDPINALLSFAYALLVKECTVALMGEGLEPHWGLYHQPRHGRPALALDIMEPLRPLIADSAVITAINTGMIQARNFTVAASACILHPAGRKALIQAFEARLDQFVTHPAFDYRCSWRAAIRLHARLLARYFRGDVPTYTTITTR